MTWDLSPEQTLERLSEEWLSDISGQIDPGTAGLYRMHFSAHLIPHFGTAPAMTTTEMGAYCRKRLKVVKRRTLLKERSTLRSFLCWCRERGLVDEEPPLPPLPKRAQGTPFAVRRRGKAVLLTPEECRALIAALPRWNSPRKDQPSFPIRARFVVMHETALRPATLDKLSVPEHYQRGGTELLITDEIDKARFGRVLPLTQRAREALDEVARVGIIFGAHNYRRFLERAAKKTIPSKAATFTAYDFRHARLTELAEKGDLPGVQYLAGHRRAETTAIYIHPNLRAARKVLSEASESLTRQGRGLVSVLERYDLIPVRAKRESRTPTPVKVLEPESYTHNPTASANELRTAAVAMLRAASEGQPVDKSALDALAILAIGETETGRLALAVLDGGEFAPRRALELARLIVADAALDAEAGEGVK